MGERPTRTVPAEGGRAPFYEPTYTQASGRGGVRQELVSLANDANSAALNIKLPPRSRIKFSSLKNHTAVTTPDGGGTVGTPDGLALVAASAATGVDATVSTQIIASTTTLTKNAEWSMAAAAASGTFFNSGTTDLTLFIMPIDSGGSAFFRPGTTTPYLFSGTADVAMMIDIDEYPELPDGA